MPRDSVALKPDVVLVFRSGGRPPPVASGRDAVEGTEGELGCPEGPLSLGSWERGSRPRSLFLKLTLWLRQRGFRNHGDNSKSSSQKETLRMNSR